MNWNEKQGIDARNEIRSQFPVGCKVKAIIYKLRHKNIYDPQLVTVVGTVTEDRIAQGFRFGVIVNYKGDQYWVDPLDCVKQEVKNE